MTVKNEWRIDPMHKSSEIRECPKCHGDGFHKMSCYSTELVRRARTVELIDTRSPKVEEQQSA